MTPTVGFLLFLTLTLAGLGGVFYTGMRAQRRRHIPLVIVTVGLLATTIYFAERLGEGLLTKQAGWITPVHLTIAKVTTVSYLIPLVTGVLTLRDARRRKLHGRIAWIVLTMTLLTAATGIWMVMASPPAPATS
ncbi:MAG: hypothetical protein O2816_18420 [Planctomycetota bacterium]|nr:hypothetical protein [Planctomycetota bacterium]